jgi:hypothetical protein
VQFRCNDDRTLITDIHACDHPLPFLFIDASYNVRRECLRIKILYDPKGSSEGGGLVDDHANFRGTADTVTVASTTATTAFAITATPGGADGGGVAVANITVTSISVVGGGVVSSAGAGAGAGAAAAAAAADDPFAAIAIITTAATCFEKLHCDIRREVAACSPWAVRRRLHERGLIFFEERGLLCCVLYRIVEELL